MARKHVGRLVALIAGLVMLLGVGCVIEDPTITDPDDEGKEDRWNRSNDPRNFGQRFEYNYEKLRQYAQGSSEIVPWPDTYWPMQEDGYNQRWQGSSVLSPVEAYDQAFNGWTPPEGFMKLRPFSSPGSAYDKAYYEQLGPAATWAHQEGGNYIACNGVNDDSDEDQTVDEDWEGMEGWWGHCHAWAPAAFSAPEPQRSVTVNGVTFQVADIKALIEATYEGGGSVFLGGRCNLRTIERDSHGRIIADECRDTNAGAFHVVAVNMLGILRKSFVIDATYSMQVWNQPVRDYTITTQEVITEAQALQLLGRTDVTSYPYNSDARSWVHVVMNFRYVVEGSASTTPYLARIDSYTRTQNYDYILELDAQGNIIGGEWVDADPHPDFLWAPTGNSDVRNGWMGDAIITTANVQRLIDLSTSVTPPPPPAGTEHPYTASPALAIPDNDRNGVSNTIAVPDSLTIAGLRVDVNITHTYRGDLTVELVRNGQTVSLVANQGGGEDNLTTSFNVADFNGQNASGDWTLVVRDTAGQDVGTLNTWGVVVVTAQ